MLSLIYKTASTTFLRNPTLRATPTRTTTSAFALFSSSTLASSSNPSTHQKLQMAAKDFVEKTVAENNVVIFSKTWCPYCKRAKNLFTSKYPDVKTVVVELDERDDGNEIQSYLLSKTGQRTVPSVWIGHEHIGGSDDLMRLDQDGQVSSKLGV